MKNNYASIILMMIISCIICMILSIKMWEIITYKQANFILKQIKIESINEGYEGQIILELDGKYYEYEYNYKGEF